MEQAMMDLLRQGQQQMQIVNEAMQALKSAVEKDEKGKVGRFGDASKVVRQPDVFGPNTAEEEASQWSDWRLSFKSWLLFANEKYEKDLDEAEKASSPLKEMTEEQQTRSETLHSILSGMLRNRPLKVLRAVEGRNGLSLLQAVLNFPSFTKDKTYLEQILNLERIIDEYQKVSNEALSSNTKLSVLLRVIPQHLRQHVQLSMTETTSYDEVRERVVAFERTTSSWTPASVFKEMHIDNGGPMDMEVDRIYNQKGKGKGKDTKGGKGKGKGKYGGKDSKGKGKAGGKDSKGYGKGKQKGKGKDKGSGKGKGLSADMCKICHGYGHWSRECPQRVRQVGGEPSTTSTTTGGSGESSTSSSTRLTSAAGGAVRRVSQVFVLDEEEDESEVNIQMLRMSQR